MKIRNSLIAILTIFSLNSFAQESLEPESKSTESVSEQIEEIKSNNFSHFYNTAVIQGLNKTTAKTSILEMRVGDLIKFGQIQIIAHNCWQAPLDQKPESKILVEVLENKDGKNKRIFYGWMFASSPSISGLEHPIYDLTALSCKNK